MTIKEKAGVIEGILFTAGEPVEVESLMQGLLISPDEVKETIKFLQNSYSAENSGIIIVELDGAYQMASNPQYDEFVCGVLQKKKKPSLTNATLEVLSIVAYNQPVTKGYVEQVRGVESGNIVNNLEEKGYLEELGKLDAPGRPSIYGTTKEFLRVFGLKSINDLPKVQINDEDNISLEGFDKVD